MLMIKLIGLRTVKNIKIKPNFKAMSDSMEIDSMEINNEELFEEESVEMKSGNILYTAPELLEGSAKLGKIDVFS